MVSVWHIETQMLKLYMRRYMYLCYWKRFHEKRPKCLKSDHRAGLNWGKMYSLYAFNMVSLLFSCSLHSNLPSDFHKFSAHFAVLFQTSQTLQGTFQTILFWDPVCLSHSWSYIKTMHSITTMLRSMPLIV